MRMFAIAAAMGTILTGTAMAQKNLVIENGAIAVSYDVERGEFSLSAKPSGKTFVRAGTLSGAGGEARRAEVKEHPELGKAQSIEIVRSDGSRDAITLCGDQPFAFFVSGLRNSGSEPTVTRSVRPCMFTVDLEKPAAELKTLGTGGLATANANMGSYVWLAVADPKSRAGVVTGWVTNERGSGVVLPKVEGDKVRLTAQIDYGRLRLEGGASESLETLAVGYFDDARLGLEAWADTVAKINHIKLRPQPTGYCTWYSSPHGGAADEKSIAELAAFAAKELAPYGFSFVQIDDGWQDGASKNGPHKNFTRVRPNGPYASGMKATADKIKALGLVAGIWLMPFSGSREDPWYADKQDLFARRDDGKPHESPWGGVALDLSNPKTLDYLREEIRQIVKDWGYDYLKMDGLCSGAAVNHCYVNDAYKDDKMGDAVLFNPKKTNIEAFRDGLKTVREAAGENVFILGCCAPQNMRSYGGAFGLVDAMRIGPDNGAAWGGLCTGPRYGSRNYHLHGRIWYNDPDPVYVRANIPMNHAQLICSWAAITGQMNLNSEWLPALPADRLDVLRRTMPSHGLLPRPVDLFENPIPRIWLLTDARKSPRHDVIGLFNWDGGPVEIDVPLDRIGLKGDAAYAMFDYWNNAFLPPAQGSLKITVPGQSCRILAVGPVSSQPQVLSTSRHVTQGIVDLLDEKWDAAGSILSGRSKLVGGDAYELRIAVPADGKTWSVASVDVSSADKAVGVTIAAKEPSGAIRVLIQSPANREVDWMIRFDNKEADK